MTIRHHLTIDVEEYFHASAMEPFTPRHHWDELPRRSPRLVRRLLEHLDRDGARATFFVLGWLAEREPGMVKAIAEAGHEVASHGWDHRRVDTLSADQFRQDLRRSRDVLQELTGQRVGGYRAPSFSILPGSEWALDAMLEEGFAYDSSMFPVRVHPTYGYPGGRRDPHRIFRPGGTLVEVPPATLRLGAMNLPAAGGAYLRFFPGALVHRALLSAESRRAPGTVYVHPWEFDEEMPSFRAPWSTRLRMRFGVGGLASKLSSLTERFRFQAVAATVGAMGAQDLEARA